MYTKKILFPIISLILATIACSFNIDLPITTKIKTGPTVTDPVDIPLMGGPETTYMVTLGFGAGDLSISAGANEALVSGEVTYNVSDLKPDISIENEIVNMKTGNLELDGIPNFNEKVKNNWDLHLGSVPIDLTIKAGAYKGNMEFGNLSIVNLHISDGASEVDVNFDQLNRTEMKTFRYETGASDITLNHLSNANFNTMIFQSGAGNYNLDFSGDLQRDCDAFIESGLSTMTITVPENLNTRLTIEGGLTNINSRGSWEQSGSLYTISGEGPTLTITLEMTAGNLILRNP